MTKNYPKGLIAIIALYGIAILSSIYIIFYGIEEEMLYGVITALIAISIFIGLINKNNIARIAALIGSSLVIISCLISLVLSLWLVLILDYIGISSDFYIYIVVGYLLVISLNVLILWYLKSQFIIQVFKDQKLKGSELFKEVKPPL